MGGSLAESNLTIAACQHHIPSFLQLVDQFSTSPELGVERGEEFSADSPSTTAPMTWWILPWMALSLANRAAETFRPVVTAGLKALREARAAEF
jgi:hypothetical protein